MVDSNFPEFRCQFWIYPSEFAVVRMFLVLKLLFSGRHKIYEKGVLVSDVIVNDRFLFLVLKTFTVPFSHATYN